MIGFEGFFIVNNVESIKRNATIALNLNILEVGRILFNYRQLTKDRIDC